VSQQLVRKSAIAEPSGYTAGYVSSTATTSSRTSTQGSAPTSNAFVSFSNDASQALKHHWGRHHGQHGLL
jgi:hypothetical protein